MPAAQSGFDLKSMRASFDQPAFRRAIPALVGGAALSIAALAWWSLQEAPQRPLFAELGDGDKAAVLEALQASNVAHSVDRDTGAVTVAEDDVHRARILLAGQGLPKSAPSSASMVASLPMGSSRAIEGEALRGGREADLARTIEAIDAVKSARVHLATPEPSVFVREAAAPAASVMLTLRPGRSLGDAQVGAIKHLVAAAVPSLGPDQVTIIDQAGTLLSQPRGAGSDLFDLQVRLEERYRQSLLTLLTPVAGAGNVSTEVRVDVDRSESQSTRETFPKDDRALTREESTRSDGGYGAPTSGFGVPGALSNQPPADPQLGPQPGAQQNGVSPVQQPRTSQEDISRTFDVGREISVTHQPTGRVRRVTVAVVLREAKGSKPRTRAEREALENLIKGAIGFDAARGDTVALTSRPFAVTTEEETPLWEQPWFMPAIRQAGAVLVALLVLFLIGLPLVRAAKARLERAPNRPADGPSNSLAGPDAVTVEMIESAPSYAARADLIRDYVRQDPKRAALVARTLVREGGDG